MTSPLVPMNAVKTFYVDVYLDEELPGADTIKTFNGDDIEIVYTIYNTRGEAADLTGCTATFDVALRSRIGPAPDGAVPWPYNGTDPVLSLAVGTGIVIDGSTIAASLNTADLSGAGEYLNQVRITKSGSSITVAQGYIENDIMVG